LFSQQTGFGFYSKATITLFSYLHCYLNIPDTSGRDSLFQAEARRCKNILSIIENSGQNQRHFCIFDELYSGTNPYEAISSAISFLKYLNKYKNVNYILTTHYIDLCKKLDNNENNINFHMNIIEKENDFKYTYELKNGISSIKGGIKVLKDLDYPEEIIMSTKKLIKEINI
jgi:DNA mismatch repair protein MutS